MKILIARHADPDYEKDSLTPEGFKEAEALAVYLKKYHPDIKAFYCSTFGRARDTIAPTLKTFHREATYYEWLHEFNEFVDRMDRNGNPIHIRSWDWLPRLFEKEPAFLDIEKWKEVSPFKESGVPAYFDEVCVSFDALLARHGYVRDGQNYRVVEGNHDTILIVCHFGLMGVLLSHILNLSPLPFWQGTVALPSSLTTLVSEEREKGIALFRMNHFGSTAHLKEAGLEDAFAARFCECFEDDTRHD